VSDATTDAPEGGKPEEKEDGETPRRWSSHKNLMPLSTSITTNTARRNERSQSATSSLSPTSSNDIQIDVASLRKRHATEYAPKAEKSLKDATERRYLSSSGLTKKQFNTLYDSFALHSRIASSEHGIKDYRRISNLNSFIQVMKSITPTTENTNETWLSLFHAFDSDGTGSVDVDELFCGVSILNPMSCELSKMQVCFDLFDHNGCGFISGVDIVHMIWTIIRLNGGGGGGGSSGDDDVGGGGGGDDDVGVGGDDDNSGGGDDDK
jgi:Ca2+-binding EF-hand superfamily protein